jgi:hypothetical protein
MGFAPDLPSLNVMQLPASCLITGRYGEILHGRPNRGVSPVAGLAMRHRAEAWLNLVRNSVLRHPWPGGEVISLF